MPRPICVPCRREMTALDNGHIVHILQSSNEPYQIWSGDLWECPECGNQAVIGFGRAPVASHFEDDFDKWLPQVDLEIPS